MFVDMIDQNGSSFILIDKDVQVIGNNARVGRIQIVA
jgi:hypothetical protein